MSVSVIIPCYNSEKYLSETVQSVLQQSYKDLEIICVDNGSTDNTIQILSDLAEKHKEIKIYHQKIKGAPAARNMGLAAATGAYVQFLDSDDLLVPEKIQQQLDFLQKGEFDLVVSDRSVYNESMEHLIATHTFEKIATDPLAVSISDIIITGNPLYMKSSFIAAGGWDESLESAQDWELHIRLALKKLNFGYLPGIFLKSRSHKSSLSADWLNVTKNGVMVLEKFQPEIMSGNSFKNESVRKKIFFCYFDLAVYSGKVNENIQKLNSWNLRKSSKLYLTGINRILTILFGLGFTIKLRAFFTKKN